MIVVPSGDRPLTGWRLRPARPKLSLALVLTGSALLVWSAVLHLYLYSYYFHTVPTIGPLFIAQGAAGTVLAGVLVVSRKAVFALAAAALLALTACALLFSVWFGLFGYHERMSAPYTSESLGVEVAGVVVLAGAAALLAGHRTAQATELSRLAIGARRRSVK